MDVGKIKTIVIRRELQTTDLHQNNEKYLNGMGY
jgi:hypothetical protein